MFHTIKAIRLPRRSVKLAVSCAVMFAAVGAWGSSASAATLPCIYRTFFPSSAPQQCVKDAQGLLDSIKAHDSGAGAIPHPKPLITLLQDGIYGPQTKLGITNFQYDVIDPRAADGILGPVTWEWICDSEVRELLPQGGTWTAGPPASSLGYWTNSGCNIIDPIGAFYPPLV